MKCRKFWNIWHVPRNLIQQIIMLNYGMVMRVVLYLSSSHKYFVSLLVIRTPRITQHKLFFLLPSLSRDQRIDHFPSSIVLYHTLLRETAARARRYCSFDVLFFSSRFMTSREGAPPPIHNRKTTGFCFLVWFLDRKDDLLPESDVGSWNSCVVRVRPRHCFVYIPSVWSLESSYVCSYWFVVL